MGLSILNTQTDEDFVMNHSTYTKQLAFFNDNIYKTKTKPTIVDMVGTLMAMFSRRNTVSDIKETLTAAINVFDLINHENYGDYMLPNRAICSNLVKAFDKTLGNSIQPSDMIVDTISVISYFFYKNSKIKDLVDCNDQNDVYLVKYPIPSNVEFYSISNYWHGEQGKMRVDYIMWLNRHFKLILKVLETTV